MSKLFITGATGNIGSLTVEALKKENADFTCGVQAGKTIEGVSTVAISFDDVDNMASAMEGHDIVFVLAPLAEQMKEWSLNIIEAAKKAKVKHIVRSSGYGANTESDHMLLKEHGLIDEAVINSGLDFTITRPNTFMQNFAYFYGQGIKESGMIYLPNGKARISYSDVRDVGLANAKILMDVNKHKNKVYNLLGAPIETSEIASILGDLLEKEVKYVPVSVEDASQAMSSMGMPTWVVEALDSLNAFGALGGTDVLSSDLEQVMGQAAITFEAFARDYKSSWQ